jgi:hypothetical protein
VDVIWECGGLSPFFFYAQAAVATQACGLTEKQKEAAAFLLHSYASYFANTKFDQTFLKACSRPPHRQAQVAPNLILFLPVSNPGGDK